MDVLAVWACFDPACEQVEGLTSEGHEPAIVLACTFDMGTGSWWCECGPGTGPWCDHVQAVAAVHLTTARPP